MSSLNELIGEVRAGRVPVEEAAPRLAELSRMDITFLRMAGALDEADDTDTFVEVEAAHLMGHLTDEQYAVIREAVL